MARELKTQGKVRYVGVTHYVERAQDELADMVQAEKPDFLQINYSVVSRGAEKRVLPLARDLGVAVMINRAFEDGKLFAQVKDKPLPTGIDGSRGDVLGAGVPEIRTEPSSGDRGDPRHRQAGPAERQPQSRHRPGPRRSATPITDRGAGLTARPGALNPRV